MIQDLFLIQPSVKQPTIIRSTYRHGGSRMRYAGSAVAILDSQRVARTLKDLTLLNLGCN
jgi:hypothetical protein